MWLEVVLPFMALGGLFVVERWLRKRKPKEERLTPEEREKRFDEMRRKRSEEIKALRKGQR